MWANTIARTMLQAAAAAASDQDTCSTIYGVGGVTKLRTGAILRRAPAKSNSQNLSGKSEIDCGRKQKLQFVDLSKSQCIAVSRKLRNVAQLCHFLCYMLPYLDSR